MPVARADDRPRVAPASAEEWRSWLEANHACRDGVWLVFAKNSLGKQPISQQQALEEALCFGWIDSQMRPVDDGHFIKLFTPRRPGSAWSQRNLDLARELIADGRMRPAGEAAIDWSKEGWEKAFDTPPPELLEALQANERAWREFQAMPAGRKRIHVHYVLDAKREDARRKRIERVVELLAKGEHIGIEYTYAKKAPAPGKP